MNREDLREGQEVRVFTSNRFRGQPDGGWPAEVTKVGRTLVTITWDRWTDKFQIDTGHIPDGVGAGTWFKTPEQAALDDRKDAAIRVLREHKVSLGHGHGLTLEQVEAIAAIVAPDEKSEDKETQQ